MKNLVNKVRHHGRKVTIHLKRHHRKYLFGALCSGILALIAVHTASTINNIFANTYSQELLEGFIYAKSRGLTDAEDIDNANLSDSVSKIELADIISNYSINILNLELDDTKGCDLPSDVSGELNAEYHSGYTNLCQLGILIETGVDFNPTDTGTKAIFGTWLSRALNANNTGLLEELNSIEPYYSGHLNWLYEQELFNNSENPEAIIVKGYLFVILMMSDISYVPVEECTAEEVLACMDSDNYELCINICNDKTPPTCDVEFSTSSPTSGNVEAILTGCDESVTVTNNNGSTGYTFTGNGSFTFEFEDLAGNTGEKTAEVDWIDKEAPQCGTRTYSPAEASGLTNQNVTATLSRGDTGSGPSSASTGCDITGNNQTCSVVITDNAGNSTGCTSDIVTRIDRETITCDIEYSTTGRTNQNVTATLVCDKDIVVTNNSGSTGYTFENTGTFLFEFHDLVGNTGEKLAEVDWIDKIPPTCNVAYNPTGSTTGNVVASLTGCSETITGTDLQHTFTGNGTYTFEFQDLVGNTGSAEANVTWISNNPTCNVKYSTTGYTNKPVLAHLTGCNRVITGTELQYTFTGNGEHTFEFQDLLGVTGSTRAIVTWITDNTTYVNIEGYEFRWNDLRICNPDDSRECITIMDRNLGAATNDISKTGSYGYKYQWGNNYGFKDGCWIATGCSDDVTSGALSVYTNGAEWRSIYDNSGYYGKVFIKGGLNTYWSDYKVHNHLWGGGNDNSGSNWGYPVSNPADRQGPCPDGYHVPSAGERSKIVGRWIERSNTGLRAQGYKGSVTSSGRFLNWIFDNSGSYAFHNDFNIPLAGIRSYYDGSLGEFGEDTSLWTSSAPGNESIVVSYYFARSHVEPGKGGSSQWNRGISNALPIRCFKNTSNTTGHHYYNDIYFSININDTINAGEYTDFTVKVMKNGATFKNYDSTIYFILLDQRGNYINTKYYDISEDGFFDFEKSNKGRKTFKNGLRIKKAGTYKLEVHDLFDDDIMGSEIITVKGNNNSSDFEYDYLKFNPNYSDEMNEAYQYARYYDITTKDSIKQADMTGGLNRIAMAKMLVNYAENVLGINDYNTSKNCTFKDVSTTLDRSYDYGVTKACQLNIMGINMKDNKFNPYGTVTRAEFATALSRLLYNTKDGVNKYYSTHISKLYNEGIITNTDPTLKEKRGYVMIMLKRVAEQ